MAHSNKSELRKRTLTAIANYGAHLTLFRNAVNESSGLNPTDMECLRFLFLNGVATPTALARHTGLTSGATTAMLDRLEASEMIERRPNPNDRRGSLIAPAKSAAARAASWFESARKAQESLVASFSEHELEIIAEAFEKFTKLWDQEREKLKQ